MGKASLSGALFLVVLVADPAVAQQPQHDPKKLFEEAQRYLLAHEYPKAEQGFREVLTIDPQSVGA